MSIKPTAFNFAELIKQADRLAAYEDTGLEPEEIRSSMDAFTKMVVALELYKSLGDIDHICDLIQAEQDGLLLKMPCKPGTELFGHCRIRGAQPISRGAFWPPYIPVLGKDAWLTREAAEAALKEGAE